MKIGKWYIGFVVRRKASGWTANFPDEFGYFGIGHPPMSVLTLANTNARMSRSVARRLGRS